MRHFNKKQYPIFNYNSLQPAAFKSPPVRSLIFNLISAELQLHITLNAPAGFKKTNMAMAPSCCGVGRFKKIYFSCRNREAGGVDLKMDVAVVLTMATDVTKSHRCRQSWYQLLEINVKKFKAYTKANEGESFISELFPGQSPA